ncbi:MAG: M18 family aminopeptidase [Clostridiales bacterium]|jgi:aspartyl aminopeptidase|nr:M18 family aminopeptidase [Clostridiales bacterium]
MIQKILDFINESPTAFHAVKNIKNILDESGFCELDEKEKWSIKQSGSYYVVRNNSSIIAFIYENDGGFRSIGTHTDSPCFKLKPMHILPQKEGCITLNTQPYAKTIMSTWFDRPLSIAGRIVFADGTESLVNLKKPLFIIPNIAIHLNKAVNDGYKYNAQKDLLPLAALSDGKEPDKNFILDIVCKDLGRKANEVDAFDLFLYDAQKGGLCGINNEFISSARIDNLALTFAALNALVERKSFGGTKNALFCAFDNEEIGSLSYSGAQSDFLKTVLKRIFIATGKTEEHLFISLANSVLISADAAHAAHPNYSEKTDGVSQIRLGGGLAIKCSARMNYATTATSAAILKRACEKAGVPYQYYAERSDNPVGCTIGPIITAATGIKAVDAGIPMFSMHSVRELAAVSDIENTLKAFSAFYL